MTLDRVLNTALQARGTKAVLLLNEFHVPIAGESFTLAKLVIKIYTQLGRGDLPDADVQVISQLLSWTDVDSTGRIALGDG